MHSKNRVQNFAVQNRCLKKLGKVLPNLVPNTKSLRNFHRGKRGGNHSRNRKQIPVLVRQRITKRTSNRHIQQDRNKCLITIHIEKTSTHQNRKQKYDLPSVLLLNARSLQNKFDDMSVVADINNADLIAITETWFNENTPLQLFSLSNYNLFFKSRKDRVGGGVALYGKQRLNCKQLPVQVPDGLEVLWIQMRPPKLPRQVSSIIICVIYFPPRDPLSPDYIDHITSTIDELLIRYPGAGISIIGDFNDLDIEPFLQDQRFKQVVQQPTRGENILDMIIKNYSLLYHSPEILCPIANSDHNCVLWQPRFPQANRSNKIRKKNVRPLTDSGRRVFGSWITQHSWEEVLQATGVNDKLTILLRTVQEHLDDSLLIREIRFHEDDKPWMTSDIKSTIQNRQRAWCQDNKPLWRHFKNKVAKAIPLAKSNYHNTRISNLKRDDPAGWHNKIKILTQGRKEQTGVDIPGIDSSNPNCYTETANKINEHFISIAEDLPHLDSSFLPAYLPSPVKCPFIECQQVYKLLSKINLQKSSITGDLPVRILREFSYELCVPLADILNVSFEICIIPNSWKHAQIVPIPKKNTPTITDLRPIALTSHFAKICESFIVKWLLEDIDGKIDIHQYGNRPMVSTCHYLIKLLHQLYENADSPKSISTLVLTDLSKAFDRIDHNILIRKLIDLGVRPCVISLVVNFLQNRTQCVKYRGTISDSQLIHTGVPQGTKLGPVLFLIMINDACKDEIISYYKYVDDLTLVESRKCTQISRIQESLNNFQQWTNVNNMKLNAAKCHAMVITFMKRPLVFENLLIGNVELDTVKFAKILGVIVQSNLKWDLHIKDTMLRCNRKLYMLRRLKSFNFPRNDLLTIYMGYIRPVLDYCVPVFNGNITQEQILNLERIQKRVLRIILGGDYITYVNALSLCNLITLEARRKQLCEHFVISLEKHPVFNDWLPVKRENRYNFRNSNKYDTFKCKTQRFQNSALPYLVRILNNI